ncbi:hypothetical protein FAM09_13410 [Niastella caeni]|uniref:Glycosyltransferase RgtA/B/C/D-like domain-containing protein n=1 Tax=Niastella caeni TaxID=2569763 RepID=A0A4V6T3T6_9BACT|nr:hypothetical protein [Niastella caeni]THU39496.1 hypothetical protein FAM09_13410 [Niastella caeni]
MPFKQWIWQDKENKQLLWFSIIIMIISFAWLKYVYPFPNFIPPDSNNYLEAANNNDFISIWPIGYSKFLRLISIFSRSHFVLVILQYLLLMGSVLYFLFSIRYLLSPGKWLFRALLTISIINPLLPHIANFVSSDCLFVALSLTWFTQLLWIIYQPKQKLLLLHAIVLLLAFMVRFTAVWYPFFSIVLIALTNIPRRIKWVGIGAIALLLFLFIGRTQYEYKVKTGTVQYAAFGGWQLAANALYGYAHSQQDDPTSITWKYKELHILVNHHMDSLDHLVIRPDQKIGVYYLWNFKSPLRVYPVKSWKITTAPPSFFEQWATMAPYYASYGRWLIAKHPWSFIKHFIWPNLVRYYAPPAFFMEKYNLGNKQVDPIVVTWFDWTNNQLPTRAKNRDIRIANIFPNLLAILNPLFLISTIAFVGSKSFRRCNKISKRIVSCMGLVWFSNAFFSVLSAPIELRYQLFPFVITLSFSTLFISSLIMSLSQESETNKKQVALISETAM